MPVLQCRVCLSTCSKYMSLEADLDSEYGLTFLEGFNLCTRLDAQLTDDFPKYLCVSCSDVLRVSYNFMRKAETADKMFKDITGGKEEQDDQDEHNLTKEDEFSILSDCDENILNIISEENSEIEDAEQELFARYESYDHDFEESVRNLGDMDSTDIVESVGIENVAPDARSECLSEQHTCHECGRDFLSSQSLMEHLNLHKGLKPFKCDLCFRRFAVRYLLKQHLAVKHSVNRQVFVYCQECDKPVLKKYFNRHHKHFHNKDEVSTCPHCGKTMERRWYPSHLKEVHGTAPTEPITIYEKLYPCTECPLKLSSLSILESHIAKQHKEKTLTFTCETCGKTLQTSRAYRKHAKTHNPNRKKFPCSLCKREFAFKRGLHLHMKLHSGGEFKCHLCDKIYVRQYDLNVHLRKHNGDADYACDQCDKRYKAKVSLNDHIKSIHMGIIHSCEVCGAEFKCKQSLKDHMLNHASTCQHWCSICNEGFLRRHQLRGHLKLAHNVEYTDAQFEELYPRRNLVKRNIGKEQGAKGSKSGL